MCLISSTRGRPSAEVCGWLCPVDIYYVYMWGGGGGYETAVIGLPHIVHCIYMQSCMNTV